MSNDKDIYSQAILFSVISAVVVIVGTIATVFIPMFTEGMNPKLKNLKPYTAVQLAGRDIYQREGCVNCHSQTVRPLRADVLRYGEYSKAGEFAYDHPFLWGSRRIGPDLARIGGKYPDEWHVQHFSNPRAFYSKSNMPKYAFLSKKKLDGEEIRSHMKALDFPFKEDEINDLKNKTEMDALVSYIQVLGIYVNSKPVLTITSEMIEKKNPFKGKKDTLNLGKKFYDMECAGCHGKKGEGNIGSSLVEYAQASPSDADTYVTIANGFEGDMPGFVSVLSKREIWSVVAYVHSMAVKYTRKHRF